MRRGRARPSDGDNPRRRGRHPVGTHGRAADARAALRDAPRLGSFVDVKALDGVLNISWNTDQLHRLGAGREPDLDRGRLATTVAMLRRNGTTSFRPKRGIR